MMSTFRVLLSLRQARSMLALSMASALSTGASSVGLLVTLSRMIALPEARNVGNVLWFLGFGCVLVLSQAANRLILGKLALRTEEELRCRLMRLLLAVRLRTVETIGRSTVMSCLADDVSLIGAGLQNLPHLAANTVVVCGCLAYLAWLSPVAFLLTMLALGAGIVLHGTITRRAERHSSTVIAGRTHLFRHFDATASGAKELRLDAVRRTHLLTRELADTLETIHRHGMSAMAFHAGSGMLAQGLFLLTLLSIIILPTLLGPDAVGDVAGSAVVVLYTMGPVEAAVSQWPILVMASAALRKIDAFGLELTGAAADETGDVAARPTELHTLELKGVTLSFLREGGDRPFALGPIDLRLRSGEVVFLTGENGSGKTTLGKLITGLYPPDDGEILIDGHADASLSRSDQRRFFSAIFSDYHLFDTILPCDREAAERVLPEWLGLFGLEQEVRVGNGLLEGTDKLSTGQRKRVALAMALVQDRPAYLFDEWAADQDPRYRRMFYDEVLPQLRSRNKLVIVISHDDAYFDRADRIITLQGGSRVIVSAHSGKVPVTHAP